jgi:hypothetical protein
MRQEQIVQFLERVLRRLLRQVVVVAKAQTVPPMAVQAAAVILLAPQAEQVQQIRVSLVVQQPQVTVRVAVAVQAQ